MPNTPEQTARNKHIEDTIRDRKPPLATYADLVNTVSPDGASFKAWRDANHEYAQCLAPTGVIGSEDQKEIVRGGKLLASRLARIEHLAPLDMATANARVPGAPSLLSSEDWDLFAQSRGVTGGLDGMQPLEQLRGDERKAAIDKFKEDNFGKFKNLISKDQFGRASEEVQKTRRPFSHPLVSVGRLMGIRSKSGAEKALTETSKADAEAEIKNGLKADVEIAVDLAITNGATKSRAELFKTHMKEAFEKVKPEEIDKKIAEIDAQKAGIRNDLGFSKSAYSDTNVDDITADMEVALHALAIVQRDVKERNKTKESGADDITAVGLDSDVKAIIKATTKELSTSILQDFHHAAREYRKRFAGRDGNMSQYGALVDANRNRISDGQEKALLATAENKPKLDANGKLKDGQHLTVNGIPCASVGVVDLYKLDTGFSFMGKAWGGGNRVPQLAKFMEAWMVETTAANQEAYQSMNDGKPLTIAKMMEAYASGEMLPDGKTKNLNRGPDGHPLNAFRISTYPVSGGLEATLQAYAELQAFCHILGIAVNVDTNMIAQNSDDASLADRIRIKWKGHKELDDPVYGVPAMKKIEEAFGLTGITDPVEKAAKLRTAIVGNDVARDEALYKMIKTETDKAVVEMKAEKATLGPSVMGSGLDKDGAQTLLNTKKSVASLVNTETATLNLHTAPTIRNN